MLKNWKLAVVLTAVAVLSACGGGGSGSDPTPKGAIAINPHNGSGAIGVNYTSQPEANSRALDDCGGPSTCIVALEFSGHGQCGSIAWGSAGAWGVGSSGSQEAADQQAIKSCVSRGGANCLIPPWLFQQCH